MKKHFSKIFILSLLTSTTVFTSCSYENESDINYSNEFKKRDNEFLKEHTPKISGSWKIQKMVVVPNNMSDIIKNDTILYNLGRIDVNVEEKEMWDDRVRFYFNGNFYFNQEIIPFKSSLVHPNLHDKSIYSLIEVDSKYFPDPTMNFDDLPEEYQLLADYFFGDNYAITSSEDGKTLIWKGLERSTKEIILTKID